MSGFSQQQKEQYNQPRKRRLKLTPRFWYVLISVTIVYVGIAYTMGFVKIARIGAQIRLAKEELATIQADNDALREQLVYMQSEEYVEEVARSELGLVKPGETAVVVVKTDAEEDPVARERLGNTEGPIPQY